MKPMLKKILNSTAKVTLFIIAFVVLVVLNFYTWSKDRQQELEIKALQEQLAQQQQENDVLAQSNDELHQKIDSLKQGSTEMIEEEARNGFGMVGEGETFYHFEGKEPQN